MKKKYIIGLLTIATLGGVMCFDASAEGMDVLLDITSSLSLSVPEQTALNIATAGGGTFGSTYFDVLASTNNDNGYTLTMTTANTYLESETIDPNTGEMAKIEAIPYVAGGITADAFSVSMDSNILNHWGISIDNTASYNPIKLSEIIKETDTDATDDVTRINLATKATSALIPATYTTKMNFQLVANVVEPDEGTEFLDDDNDVTKSTTHIDGKKNSVTYTGGSLARAYEVYYTNTLGKGMYVPIRDTENGGFTNQYKVAEIGRDYMGISATEYRFAMQDMTPEICASTTEEHSSLQVVDLRDGKSYWITKLNDGHCWMTQDLALVINKETTFTSVDTDLNSYGSKGYISDYGYSQSNGVISWTPSRDMRSATYTDKGFLAEKYDGYQAYSMSAVNVADKNMYMVDEYFYQYSCDFLIGPYKCMDFFKYDPEVKNEHRHIGNYYNWSAAIASNNTYEYQSNTMGDISQNPQNSICPKGWRLPTVAGADPTADGSPDEFYRLRMVYGSSEDSSDQIFFEAPMYFNRDGYIGDSCGQSGEECLNYAGYNIEYWSSTVSTNYNAYGLYGHLANATYNYEARSGLRPMRCVAR